MTNVYFTFVKSTIFVTRRISEKSFINILYVCIFYKNCDELRYFKKKKFNFKSNKLKI